jgi:methyl-accepting chemotaxis protein
VITAASADLGFDDRLVAAGAVATAVVAIVAALGLLWAKVVRPLLRLGRNVATFAEDWYGSPADPDRGIDERPGVMRQLHEIRHELQANSGSTLKDAVRRVENKVGGVAQRQQATIAGIEQHFSEAATRDRRLDELTHTVDQLAERVDEWQTVDRVQAEAATDVIRELGVEMHLPHPSRPLPRREPPDSGADLDV